ncbi:MAG TPA: FapA family protein [bacterium]|nr:FapA family protein [bacterium]
MTDVQPEAAAGPDPYYEIRITGKQVFLRVHPPEGGRRASLGDIQKELRRRDVPYRHEILFEIYRRAANEFELLANQEITRFDVQVEVSEDAQQAFMSIVPPDRGQDTLTPARIKDALEVVGVQKGINYEVIKEVLLEQAAAEQVLVAQGRPKVDGRDGRVELANPPSEAVWVEDNTADYRELNLINNVVEGDVIARITHPTSGQDGYDVHAHVLRARPGKRPRLKLGRNVRLNEENTELYAAKAGYVVRRGDKISVENILDVNNVDAETGNIRFHGVVRVRGQVEDAYVVEAEKGIDVGGTVGKATLRCKGDIRIHGGAFGATLECDGTLFAGFLSECHVKAGGQVVVDEYILHSQVAAKRSIKVTREPQGFITGGRVKAGTEIWAPVVGSDVSEVPTQLEVGGGVNIRKRYDALQERIETNLAAFDSVRKNLTYLQHQRESGAEVDDRKRETYETMVGSGHKLIDELLRQAELHHELLRSLAEPEEEIGMVLVAQQANPGCTVQIQTSKVNLRDPVESCAFMLMSGALKAMPYAQALRLLKQQQAQRARMTL